MGRRSLIVVVAGILLLASFGARADHGDSTGVTADTIHLGLHFPGTGAAPVDSRAVEAGLNLYWRYLHDEMGVLVHGRRVEVEAQNDQYTPSTAIQKCNEMAQRSFLLLGLTGTDQINACAGYADQRIIPYLSPGHQTAGLESRQTYAAVSASWVQQAPIIAGFIANRLNQADVCCPAPLPPPPPGEPECEPILVVPIVDLEVPVYQCSDPEPEPEPEPEPGPDGEIRIGLVRPNTPNYDDAEDALASALDASGYPLYTYTVVKDGSTQEADEIARETRRDRIDVVVSLTAPVFLTQLVGATAADDYFPRYLLFGMTAGFNDVVARACEDVVEVGGLEGASVFSPWPAWSAVNAGEFDPDFHAAAELYALDENNSETGDMLVALWGLMKNIHLMLDALGEHPTREGLIQMLNDGYAHSTGVYPDFAVDASNHFGVEAVHRLEASCDGEPQFHQAESFVTGYEPPED